MKQLRIVASWTVTVLLTLGLAVGIVAKSRPAPITSTSVPDTMSRRAAVDAPSHDSSVLMREAAKRLSVPSVSSATLESSQSSTITKVTSTTVPSTPPVSTTSTLAVAPAPPQSDDHSDDGSDDGVTSSGNWHGDDGGRSGLHDGDD